MKLRLNKNQVVNCTTQSEADKCCQLADSMGLKWEDGRDYNENGWQVGTRSDRFTFSNPIDNLEIIGNIFDNPQLLKGGEK